MKNELDLECALDFSRISANEEIWSRGSLTDSIEYEPKIYYFNDRSNKATELYRYELGGVLIYDSKARTSEEKPLAQSQSHTTQKIQITQSIKKILNGIDCKGNI
jgi:hypothetical protein